jgi:hypothetical protein
LKHDDRLDALAMAVAYWVDSMGRDEDEARQSYQEQKLEDDLRDFMDNGLHLKPKIKATSTAWFRV